MNHDQDNQRRTENQQPDVEASDDEMEQRFHQCIKDAWKHVNTPFASKSASSEVGRVALAALGVPIRRQLIFALQTAWPFIHGCKDERLIQEAKSLMRYDFHQVTDLAPKYNPPAPHPVG